MTSPEESRSSGSGPRQKSVAVKTAIRSTPRRGMDLEEMEEKKRRREDSEDEAEMDKMMQKGISMVQAQGSPKTQRYAVKKEKVQDILLRLKCGEPTIDAFADEQNNRWPRFWGKGGEEEDAWAQDCDYEKVGLLWCNAPFSDLDHVVDKVRTDGARMVFIAPDWRDQRFYQDMWEMAEQYYYYKKGQEMFDLSGVAMPGVRWGVWAVLLDGRMQKVDPVKEAKEKRTSSSRRRFRRKQAAQ